MKLQIKSIQKYQDHEEEIMQTISEAEIEESNHKVVIIYPNNQMIFDFTHQEVTIIKEGHQLFITMNEKMINTYPTPYGTIELEIIGEQMEIQKNPFLITLRYKISNHGIGEYLNTVEITKV